ncbi:hypothetical protein F5884DRAFT_784549 [Xylogone sp. PMI_703]|nr:hypothetical protein F5884DRAFT_784549 [Xylogone sp. PMI_703]
MSQRSEYSDSESSDWAPDGPDVFTWLSPELKLEIFRALPNLHSVIALRLGCSELNAVYTRYEKDIKGALRDRIVQAVSSHYDLLTTLHIPNSAKKLSPEGGWPHITPEYLAKLGKTDLVVDVLRYLPYIAETANREDNLHNVEYKCNVIDYSVMMTSERLEQIEDYASALRDEPLSRHMITIAAGYESGGLEIILDTMSSEICEEIIRFSPGVTMDVEDYFAMMAERFRKLEIIFVPGYDPHVSVKWEPGDDIGCPDELNYLIVQEEGYATERDVKWIGHLYRKFGWPGPDYRKEEALEAVKQFVESRHP